MIPVSLRLRNFMCYREGLPPLDFGDLHVACLSGANGAGKSAILDAITWSLWGRARTRSDDDLIATGAQEMEVEFEFLMEGEHYRVFRRRDRAARSGKGKSQLDLQIQGPAGWRSMAGESIRQTEAGIIGLLRMDYDTFINASFLLQGRADEFTVKPPADRKRILAEILGLSYYDVLEQRARERLRGVEQTVQTLATRLAGMERDLGRRAEHEQALADAEEEASQAEAEAAQHQGEVDALRGQVATLEGTARQVTDLRRRRAQLAEETKQLGERIVQQQARLDEVRTLLARATEIAERYERLQALRAQNEALARAASQLVALSQRQRTLEQVVARARQEHETEREVLRRALTQSTQRLQGRPANKVALRQARQELTALQAQEAERERLRDEVQGLVIEERTLQAEGPRLEEEIAQLTADQGRLSGDITQCPLCESDLSPTAHQHVVASYEEKIQMRQTRLQERSARLQELGNLLAGLRAQQKDLDKALRGRGELERRVATLEQEQRTLADLDQQQQSQSAQLQAVERILQEEDYAHADREALASVQQEMADLRYDRAEHQAVQGELANIQGVEAEFQRLRTAEESVGPAEQRLEELASLQEARTAEGEAVRHNLAELEAAVQGLPTLQSSLRSAEAGLADANRVLGQARVALGAAQRELQRLDELQQEHQARKHEHGEAREQQGLLQELAQALGKKGVQAMLIETSVPEIEREANELLAQMTDGEMALQMTMQRATKGGEGVVETLDINITAGGGGTRDFDSFSGGERFRISFALRIALSRLLARRAGASLQTLVIDEGFGTQDEQGRERLVEAIRSVQGQFEMILVITHIAELKEQFPARIEIEKGPAGSSWQVV